MTARRIDIIVTVMLAFAGAYGASRAFGNYIIGHDEGIYFLTAASLREHGEYRLTSLPSRPRQTKYPPLYPALLASVLASDSQVPSNVIRLKRLNLLFYCATILLCGVLVHRSGVSGWAQWVSVLLVAVSPGVMSSTDWLMSEQMFTALVLGVVVAAPEPGGARIMPRILTAATLAAFAALTRSVGISVCAGLVWYVFRQFGGRQAVAAACLSLSIVAPWWVWAALANHDTSSLLERYYVSYETSAWSRLLREPSFALRMVGANMVGFVTAGPTVAFATAVTSLLAAGFACVGFGSARRFPVLRLLGAIAAAYLLVVVGHPMSIDRYVIPLIPFATVFIARGLFSVAGRTSLAARTLRAPILVAMGLIVAGNIIWAHHYLRRAPLQRNAGMGRLLPFGWSGFQEVMIWIVRETPRDAVIASHYDTTYAVYTGRKGIRPWVHEAEAYDPRYGRYLQWSVDAESTATLLADASVSYIIVDPYLPDGMGFHAQSMVDGIARDHPARWALRFVSSDRLHRVYQRKGR